jgi:cytochrome oxidase Cu insertion factor (SCO1/SenC/PrrC family)
MVGRLAGACAALVLGAAPWQGNALAQPEPSRADAARFMNELMVGKVPIGGPFTLTDQNGRQASLTDFRGKVVLLYFGYTFCPDVCPTDLAAIAESIRSLGRLGEQVQPLFVTLDPARDTPEVLGRYAAAFHPRLLALTGQEHQVRRVAETYKVFFEKVKLPGRSAYVIDHSAYTFMLDRDGKYVLFFPPGTAAKRMTAKVREELAVR